MMNFSSVQIPPPKNWQDFESLCCDLWAKIWRDSNAQKNGRNGQAQHGVDISGRPYDGDGKYHGIQCKGKSIYNNNVVTANELESEVEKAKKFTPKIDSFVLATTSPKDVNIEKRAREITEKNQKNGDFAVYVFGWDDIQEKLAEHNDVILKHYPWLLGSTKKDENDLLFDFWRENAQIDKLKYNANILPFFSFDVKFKGSFLIKIRSYLLKIKDYLMYPPGCNSDARIQNAILNFNQIASDLLTKCTLCDDKYDIGSDTYTYWVDIGILPYHERGKFIEFRKLVLKVLFYNLVKAANYVIQTWNCHFSTSSNTVQFIGFIENFNYNFPLLGDPHPSPEYFPIYTTEELEIGLYQGIEHIEKYAKSQIYKG